MPRTCSVCRATRLAEIDAALLSGTAYRTVAKQFEASAPAVFRHRKEHLPLAAERNPEAGAFRLALADDPEKHTDAARAIPVNGTLRRAYMLDSVDRLQARTQAILDSAIAGGRHQVALQAVRESRGNLQLILELRGSGATGSDIDLGRLDPEELNALLRATFGELSIRERQRVLLELPALTEVMPDHFEEAHLPGQRLRRVE